MKHIVIFGAGKSSTYLIEYVVGQLAINDWRLTILDANPEAGRAKAGDAANVTVLALDVSNETERKAQVTSADIVISLLPPSLHHLVALDCIAYNKNLLTASYIDPAIEGLRERIEDKGLLFLCEMGLDPGIDHMSAMKIIHHLSGRGARITSFRSHCGGLVAPESDDNPWHYKISWNPRNVVLAGKNGAIYKENGKEMHLPYRQLFDAGRRVGVKDLGSFSYYPNRDSLSYIDTYHLHDANDFVRTTLRHPAFCSGWEKIVELELTNENIFYDTDNKSLKRFFLEHFRKNNFSEEHFLTVKDQLLFLGLEDDDTIINKGHCSAADVLQFIMEKKLALKPHDKDMIVMLHEFDFMEKNTPGSLKSSLIVKGEDNVRTAMSKTVGLPLGIAAKLILQEKIRLKGLHIPIISEIYEPVLAELATLGIAFTEY